MDLILCHQTADFDALGAAVGLSRLRKGAKIILTGGAHPTVKDFLALYKDEFFLIESRSVNTQAIRSIIVVDTQKRDRLGNNSQWLDLKHLESIEIYDHHLDAESDIPATLRHLEAVGSTTTIVTELLQSAQIELTSFEATAMALGVHVDTCSFTSEQTTARDAQALAWLLSMGANIKIIAEYVEPGLSPQLQILLKEALEKLHKTAFQGYTIASVLLKTEQFIPGLSSLASRLMDLTESDVLLLGHQYSKNQRGDSIEKSNQKLTVIGRSQIAQTNLNLLFESHGGGGHPQAASLTISIDEPELFFQQLVEQVQEQIPQPPTARDLMSSPVRTIRPDTSIEQAQRILFRYGHSGLSVVDQKDCLVGIISRRDLDLALHHGFSHAPVKGYMTRNLKTITPETSLPEIESLMVTYDVGRLPVLDHGQLIGIVTRTDVLRQLHQAREEQPQRQQPLTSCLLPTIKTRLAPPIWQLLEQASIAAQSRGWHLYLVGGGVRDLLLTEANRPLLLQDIDLVVDGFHRAADDGAGVELASTLQKMYPQARLSVHGEFQTAALLWHKDATLGNLWIDIATARTEFYPYPAANPEVEASSIRQDLYRRDFTINALAVRLTMPKKGEFSRKGDLLDFFGGLLDLRSRQIRVLHANSFIEDPTRIYRAVRFAVRLGFTIEPQTEEYIRYAISSGVYERLRIENQQAPALTTRLRTELKYILQANNWKPALKLLANLEALRCLHRDLILTKELWWQIRCLSRWLKLIDPQDNFDHWLMRLEVLIAHLKPSERDKVATHLQLPKDSIQRLKRLAQIETKVIEQLPQCHTKSEIYLLLRQYKYVDLILLAIRNSKSIRYTLWQYLTQWAKIEPPLNGNDLKQLGYQPGPIYKQILDDLLIATLDGKIDNRLEAEQFIKANY